MKPVVLGESFVPMPVEVWEAVVERLSGGPWPEELALFDLRWHFDQGRGEVLASRRQLAGRWGWEEGEVRTLLRHPERWMDPDKSKRTDRAPRHVDPTTTSADPGRPKEHRNGTAHPNLFVAPDPARPNLTSADPTTTRLVDPPSPSPSPSPSGPPSSVVPTDRAADRFDEAARFWASDVQLALGRRPSKATGRSTQVGQKLLRAVRKDADLVLDAMRFVAHSQSDRALFLRGERADGDGRAFTLTLVTVLRHLDEYAELWRAEQGGGTRLKPRARGEHPSEREPRKTVAQLEAEDPHLWDPL